MNTILFNPIEYGDLSDNLVFTYWKLWNECTDSIYLFDLFYWIGNGKYYGNVLVINTKLKNSIHRHWTRKLKGLSMKWHNSL